MYRNNYDNSKYEEIKISNISMSEDLVTSYYNAYNRKVKSWNSWHVINNQYCIPKVIAVQYERISYYV